jgi:hypothetical protein
MLVSALYTQAKNQWRHDARIRAMVGFALVATALIPINLASQFWTGISTLKPLQLWFMANNLDTADSWLPMRAAFDWIHTAPEGSSTTKYCSVEALNSNTRRPASCRLRVWMQSV